MLKTITMMFIHGDEDDNYGCTGNKKIGEIWHDHILIGTI